jgi:hypothetical protein
LGAAGDLGERGHLCQQRFERLSIGFRSDSVERGALGRVDGARDELEEVHGACGSRRARRRRIVVGGLRRGGDGDARFVVGQKVHREDADQEAGAEEQSGASHACLRGQLVTRFDITENSVRRNSVGRRGEGLKLPEGRRRGKLIGQ